MKQDLQRLSVVLLISLFTGAIIGEIFACMAIGLLLYLLWLFNDLKSLLRSLRDVDDFDYAEFSGITAEIQREVFRIRAHHSRRAKTLSSQLKRFRTATTALPDAVILLGKFGRIEWANNKAQDYLDIEWPRDEGNRIAGLLRDPRLIHMLENIETVTEDDRLEIALLTNKDRCLEFRVVPYGNEQWLLVARDITRINKTNRMRKDFIANASHELRTPLTVIAGYLESLDNEKSDGPVPGWSTIISKMRTHTTRMQRLIEDLLKLSSLESSRSSWEEVMVAEMLGSIFNEAKLLGRDTGHLFYLETNPDLWIRGNRAELYSAFSNLIFNAVQYTPAGSVIRVRWDLQDGNAVMEVIDSGDGIDPLHIPRLTERFYRVDKGRSRDRGGTGLGLAIVKHALANHNASLDISSELGKGSTFRCVFPPESIISRPVPQQAGTSLSA